MKWTEVEDRYLRMYYSKVGKEHCAKKLNKTVNAISGRVGKLKLKLDPDVLARITSESQRYEYKKNSQYIEELPVAENITTMEEYEQYNLRLIQAMSFRNVKQQTN